MTWLQFRTFTLRLNLIVLIGGWLAFWGYGVAVGDVPPLSVVPGLVMLSLTGLLCLNLALLALLAVIYALSYCRWRWPEMNSQQKSIACLGVAATGVAFALMMASVWFDADIGVFALISFLMLFGATVWLLRLLPQAIARDRAAFRLFRE